jgi:hypothetical protein
VKAILRRLANVSEPGSLSNRLRRERFQLFEELLAGHGGTVRVLDVGGEENYWEQMGLVDDPRISLTILNLDAPPARHGNVRTVAGDATALTFADGEFDVVFSNSVIEHVGDHTAQRRMADEIRRVGRSYYLQTPNRYFPVEPHFLFPFFAVLPRAVRTWLVRHFDLGWRTRQPDARAARALVDSVRLVTRSEIRMLFPDGELTPERFAGCTKSFIVRRAAPAPSAHAAGEADAA